MKASVAIKFVASDLEGSKFVHDPEATRYGIVQTEYTKYRHDQGKADRSVEFIEQYEVYAIYYKDYWAVMKCDKLPDGLDLALFQMGVNIGPGTAIKILQKVVGAVADGYIGPGTLLAIKNKPDKAALIDALLNAQDDYYDKIATDGKHDAFDAKQLNGWHNRVRRVKVFLATGLDQAGAFTIGGCFMLFLGGVALYFLFR